MSRVGSPERRSVGVPSPPGSPDRANGAEAPIGVPGGLQDPTTPINPWTPGEPMAYAPPGFPGLRASNGGANMGGLGGGAYTDLHMKKEKIYLFIYIYIYIYIYLDLSTVGGLISGYLEAVPHEAVIWIT